VDSYLVILTIGDDRVALVVDHVESLVRRTPEPAPASAGTPSFVRGHMDDGSGLITILDVGELLRPEVRDFVERAPETDAPPA
jgi:chemotaxis signal transduction protein